MKEKSATKYEGTRQSYQSAINALSRFVEAYKHTVNEKKASVPDAIPRRRHVAWHQLSRFENGRQAPPSGPSTRPGPDGGHPTIHFPVILRARKRCFFDYLADTEAR